MLYSPQPAAFKNKYEIDVNRFPCKQIKRRLEAKHSKAEARASKALAKLNELKNKSKPKVCIQSLSCLSAEKEISVEALMEATLLCFLFTG